MSYFWVVSYFRDLDVTSVGRFTDRDRAARSGKLSLDDARLAGTWPDHYRQVGPVEAEDFDALIGSQPRMFPEGTTVTGICDDCGGQIYVTEDEHREEKPPAPRRPERPRPRGSRGLIGYRSGRRPI